MNENLLDVLLYLFENFAMPGTEYSAQVRADLGEAGFFSEDIDDALAWIHASQSDEHALVNRPDDQALRLYSPFEKQLLSCSCRGYLTRLQHCGVLSAAARETVIDRLLALASEDNDMITVEQIKWVVMMVLTSNGEDQAYAQMEALMHAEQPGIAH